MNQLRNRFIGFFGFIISMPCLVQLETIGFGQFWQVIYRTSWCYVKTDRFFSILDRMCNWTRRIEKNRLVLFYSSILLVQLYIRFNYTELRFIGSRFELMNLITMSTTNKITVFWYVFHKNSQSMGEKITNLFLNI